MGSDWKPEHAFEGDCPFGDDTDAFDPSCVRCNLDRKDAEIARLRGALAWYEEKAQRFADDGIGASLIDHWAAQDELRSDAGARARRALAGEDPDDE